MDQHITTPNSELLAHNLTALSAMRKMLLLVCFFAITAIGTLLFLYLHTLPMQRQQLEMQRQQLETQQQKLEELGNKLIEDCNDLITAETNFDVAMGTLGECKNRFPKDFTLLNYEAQRSIEQYSKYPDPNHLTRAVNAAAQSLDIKPNYIGYEWQGITYCIRANQDQTSRKSFIDSANDSFKAELTLEPRRKDGLLASSKFSNSCPDEVKNAVAKMQF